MKFQVFRTSSGREVQPSKDSTEETFPLFDSKGNEIATYSRWVKDFKTLEELLEWLKGNGGPYDDEAIISLPGKDDPYPFCEIYDDFRE